MDLFDGSRIEGKTLYPLNGERFTPFDSSQYRGKLFAEVRSDRKLRAPYECPTLNLVRNLSNLTRYLPSTRGAAGQGGGTHRQVWRQSMADQRCEEGDRFEQCVRPGELHAGGGGEKRRCSTENFEG